MNDELNEKNAIEFPKAQFLVYQAKDGKLKLDVRFEGETVWLTQPLIHVFNHAPV